MLRLVAPTMLLECVPMGHFKHLSMVDAPIVEEYVLTGHGVHASLPTWEAYVPAGQSVQFSELKFDANIPLGHIRQLSSFHIFVPGAQCRCSYP